MYTIFPVNWIFSYCMIRVSIVICRYYLLLYIVFFRAILQMIRYLSSSYVGDVFIEMFYVNVNFVKDNILY